VLNKIDCIPPYCKSHPTGALALSTLKIVILRPLSGLLFSLFLILANPANAVGNAKTAVDAAGENIKIQGSIVLIEPDIELTLVTAGGLQEPRKDWSDAARSHYPKAVSRFIADRKGSQKPDFDVPDQLDPTSRLGQIMRLNQVVAISIAQYTSPGSVLATKKDPKTGKTLLDWSLGDGVQEIQQRTGADYALFTYVRDSYSSGGRNALRVFAMLAGAAVGSYVDIGGGLQIGVATLVDLRTGRVVWNNLLVKQTGDLRTEAETAQAVKELLKSFPL
jgi:hypothetical protein